MPKVLTDGNIKIGAYYWPELRKKPCLCIEKGNQVVMYGSFKSMEAADQFMDALGEMVGARKELKTAK